jgi:hypothetical protein
MWQQQRLPNVFLGCIHIFKEQIQNYKQKWGLHLGRLNLRIKSEEVNGKNIWKSNKQEVNAWHFGKNMVISKASSSKLY